MDVQALSELSLGVHCSVVGDQDIVCEYGFFVYISRNVTDQQKAPHTTHKPQKSYSKFNIIFMS